ncbi:MAG: hypothetical protein NZ899_11225 [Thermoguttaceae bacterium]|nr:hypothetical protein [Thermoguttaceae bacterium]
MEAQHLGARPAENHNVGKTWLQDDWPLDTKGTSFLMADRNCHRIWTLSRLAFRMTDTPAPGVQELVEEPTNPESRLVYEPVAKRAEAPQEFRWQ